MFFWSPSATLPPASGSAVFSTPSLSPVSELSLTLSEKFSRMRPSATIISPASTSTISPGTTSAEGTTSRAPPRTTLAEGEDMALRLCRDFSALQCWTVPSTAFRSSTAKMTIVLSALPDSMEITAAASRITTNRSLNWEKNTCRTDLPRSSARVLRPYRARRAAASAGERPARSLSISLSACAAVRS